MRRSALLERLIEGGCAVRQPAGPPQSGNKRDGDNGSHKNRAAGSPDDPGTGNRDGTEGQFDYESDRTRRLDHDVVLVAGC